jgi:hypothetical protein
MSHRRVVLDSSDEETEVAAALAAGAQPEAALPEIASAHSTPVVVSTSKPKKRLLKRRDEDSHISSETELRDEVEPIAELPEAVDENSDGEGARIRKEPKKPKKKVSRAKPKSDSDGEASDASNANLEQSLAALREKRKKKKNIQEGEASVLIAGDKDKVDLKSRLRLSHHVFRDDGGDLLSCDLYASEVSRRTVFTKYDFGRDSVRCKFSSMIEMINLFCLKDGVRRTWTFQTKLSNPSSMTLLPYVKHS